MLSSEFTLREMLPGDGSALIKLIEESPDTGRVGVAPMYTHDVYETTRALHPDSVGVVVEAHNRPGIVGNGLVRFSEGNFEGTLRQMAYLSNLHVHPNFRGRGIASAIADWRIQKARERIGADGVVFAAIQANNAGSVATAKKWMTQRIDRVQSGLAGVRAQPPQPVAGLDVRPARAEDYAEIAEKQNRFHQDYNLYEPLTDGALAAWLADAPFDIPIHNYYVAHDKDGNLLAGMGTIALGKLIPTQVMRLPLVLKLANMFMKVLPQDGVIRRILGVHLWFEEEHPEAASYLWEMLRWLARGDGTGVMIFFDTDGPTLQVIRFPNFGAQPPGTLVLQAPVQMQEDHLINTYPFSW